MDLDLLEAADILPGDLVAIVDVTNGARLETYAIAGESGSSVIGINDKILQLGNDPAEGITSGLTQPPFALNNSSVK